MAGNPQGGGASKPMGNPMQGVQGMQQNMAGMPSQYPGANMAAPGSTQQGMTGRAPMPQGFMDAPNGPGAPQMPQGMTGGQTPMAQGMSQGPVNSYTGVDASPPQMPQGQGLINPDPAQVQAMFQQAQQGLNVGAYQPQISQPLPPAAPQPQMSQPLPQAQPQPRPMPQDPRMQQNPRMTPRVSEMMPQRGLMNRPQVQGNPNAMPVTRGRVR